MVTFNTNIPQWDLLKKVLAEKNIEYWTVTKQWNKTPYSKQFDRIMPYAMILLKAHKQIVINVWGVSRYKTISDRHSNNKILTGIAEALPRSAGAGEGVQKPQATPPAVLPSVKTGVSPSPIAVEFIVGRAVI